MTAVDESSNQIQMERNSIMFREPLTQSRRNRLITTLLYSAFYVTAFRLLENRRERVFILDTQLDELIPFCPLFIIPYLLWFFYVSACLIYFGLILRDGEEYRRLACSLAVGCTLFLVISFLFPNGQSLRPFLDGDTIWERLVLTLYRSDTSTNVFPSIHVFNSVACGIAIQKSGQLSGKTGIKAVSWMLTALIVLSTMLLKQHTILDVLGAFVLNALCYLYYYGGHREAIHLRRIRRRAQRVSN